MCLMELLEFSKQSDINHSDVICTVFNIPMTLGSFRTLNSQRWLNDEIINLYLGVTIRDLKCTDITLFSTFFFTKLVGLQNRGFDYDAVSKWTKTENIFEKRCVLILWEYM